MSGSGRKALTNVREWSGGPPNFWEWLGTPPGSLGVVGNPSRMSGSGGSHSRMSGSGRAALPDVREWLRGPPECPGEV